jgi:CelD/BcsL family acetyltransferase involved in cellulose biosynthesis
MLHIELIDNLDAFIACEPAWNAVLSKSDMDFPWMSFEWTVFWWKMFGANCEMLVLVVKDDKEVVAIAPLMRKKIMFRGLPVTTIQFIANYFSNRAGMLVSDTADDVVPAVFDWIKTSKYRYDLLWLDFVPAHSRTNAQISKILEKENPNHRVMQTVVSPYIKIDMDWQHYVKNLSRKFRNKINHMNNVFKKEGEPEIVEYTKENEINTAMAELLAISGNSWKCAEHTEICNSEEKVMFYTEFARLAASRAWLKIRILKFQNVPITFLYATVYNNTLYIDKISFDEKYKHLSPGLFLLISSIQQAFMNKYCCCELLGENEQFKSKLTSLAVPHVKYWIYSNSVYGRLLYFIDKCVTAFLKPSAVPAAVDLQTTEQQDV